jgi:NAD(P)-dependent dehydrogenase (short-subunit alcohol dehydrogenase family)
MSWYECQGNMTGYTTAKAGIEGLTRGLARELGADNIRVNTLVPGWVMTERQLRDWVDAEAAADIHRNQCLKAQLAPEDISAMVLFLASDDSRMCTAQNFIVDGGWI